MFNNLKETGLLKKIATILKMGAEFILSLPSLSFDPYSGVRFLYKSIFGVFALFGFLAWDSGTPITSDYISSHEDDVIHLLVSVAVAYLFLFLLMKMTRTEPRHPKELRVAITGFFITGFSFGLSIFLRVNESGMFKDFALGGTVMFSWGFGYVASMVAMHVFKILWLIVYTLATKGSSNGTKAENNRNDK